MRITASAVRAYASDCGGPAGRESVSVDTTSVGEGCVAAHGSCLPAAATAAGRRVGHRGCWPDEPMSRRAACPLYRQASSRRPPSPSPSRRQQSARSRNVANMLSTVPQPRRRMPYGLSRFRRMHSRAADSIYRECFLSTPIPRNNGESPQPAPQTATGPIGRSIDRSIDSARQRRQSSSALCGRLLAFAPPR